MISVIIPVYNLERYLCRCIDSVLCSTYTDFELILVDDGSDDGSEKICDRYANEHENVRCIHKQNEGACYARADGMHAAKGKYVGFVDSDDWIESEMYEVLMREIRKNHVDIITNGFIFEDDNILLDLYPEGIYGKDNFDIVYKSMIYNPKMQRSGMTCSVCTKVYRKNLLERYMKQSPKGLQVWEDLAYVYLPFLEAERIQITHHAFYHYIQRDDSTSHRYDLDLFENTVNAFRIIQKIYSNYGEVVVTQLEQLCLHCLSVLAVEEMERNAGNLSLKNYCQHIRGIGSNKVWSELEGVLENKNAYIPDVEKKICIDLVEGNVCAVFMRVRGRKNWRRIKWMIIKTGKMVKGAKKAQKKQII